MTVFFSTTPNPSFQKEGTTLGARCCSGRHGGLPLRLAAFLTILNCAQRI